MSAFCITRSITLDEVATLVLEVQTLGYCVVKDYVLSDKLTGLNDAVEDCYGQFSANFKKEGYVPPVGIQSVIRFDRIINNVFHFNRTLLEMATAGSHLGVVKHFLNDPFYKLIPKEEPNFILAQLNARAGQVSLPFHVDTRMCTVGSQTMSIQGYLSLGETHSGNGGLCVVPGSHTSGTFPNSTVHYPDAVSLNLNPGDLVLFSGELYHATTACPPGETPVWTVLFTYRCWWVKQQYDIQSIVPEAWFKELKPNQKLIVGACSRVSSDIYDSSSSRKGYEGL